MLPIRFFSPGNNNRLLNCSPRHPEVLGPWVLALVAFVSFVGEHRCEACIPVPYLIDLFEESTQRGLTQSVFLTIMGIAALKGILFWRSRPQDISPFKAVGTLLVANVVSTIPILVCFFFSMLGFMWLGGAVMAGVLMNGPMQIVGRYRWVEDQIWNRRVHKVAMAIFVGWCFWKFIILQFFLSRPHHAEQLSLLDTTGLSDRLLATVLMTFLLGICSFKHLKKAWQSQDYSELMPYVCGGYAFLFFTMAPSAASALEAQDYATYWWTKIGMCILITAFGLVLTTAMETIVVQRMLTESSENRPGTVSTFSTLLRVNSWSFIIVFGIFALQALPERLRNPGFLLN